VDIRLENAGYVYPRSDKPALDGVTLHFSPGSITAVMGESGSGKSTLLRLLNALRLPSSGDIFFDGRSVGEWERKEIRKKVGLVFQYPEDQLFEKTVLDDVAFGPKNMGKSADEARSVAEKALRTVGIEEDKWNRSPLLLSGGEKRRVALAGILSLEGEVLVLDEISSGLDGRGKDDVFSVLTSLKSEGKTIIFTTHDPEEAAEYADSVVLLEKGKVRMTGSIRDVYSCNPSLMTRGAKLRAMLEERGITVKGDMDSISDTAETLSALIR
jgi:energy-coupling factor transport system ATP-binding protein